MPQPAKTLIGIVAAQGTKIQSHSKARSPVSMLSMHPISLHTASISSAFTQQANHPSEKCWHLLQDAVVIGGLDMQQQAKALAKRPHVVVATPGRLRVCLLELGIVLLGVRQRKQLRKKCECMPSVKA